MRRLSFVMASSCLVTLSACDAGTSAGGGAGADATSGESAAATDVTSASGADATTSTAGVADALADNAAPLDVVGADAASGDAVRVHLLGDRIEVEGDGVVVAGTTATVVAAGTYRIDGALDDGAIVVDTTDAGAVVLALAGVDITSTAGSPLAILDAEEAVVVVVDGTVNRLADAAVYVFPSADVDEPDAALFSTADLGLVGAGTLTVAGRYNDGIASKDALVIDGPTLAVSAVDDGIRGKDQVVVDGGTITVDAGGDGVKADNAEDTTQGYVLVTGGALTITAGGDGIDAATDVLVTGGDVVVVAGGGSGGTLDASVSTKGIKGSASVVIGGGTIDVDASDDAIHSNVGVVIDGGALTLASGDDGVHADEALQVSGGVITVTASYEGLESLVLTIDGGDIHVTSRDDGVNAAGGVDGSGGVGGPGGGGGAADGRLYMNGGRVVVDAVGDGVDINGGIVMTGGALLVSGPTAQMNGALDYDSSFTIVGGLVVAAGSSGMAMAPSASGSTQRSVLIGLTASQAAGTLFHLRASDGTEVVTFAPANAYQSVAVSSPVLAAGQSYEVWLGGSHSGAVVDGLYDGGAYAGGTRAVTFTSSAVVTTAGSVGGGGFGGP